MLADARDTIGAATRSNVSVYSIDPRGLAGLSDEFIDLAEPQTATRTQREQLGTQGIERDLRNAQDNLRMLAEQTGGLSIVNSNDFAGGFERIVRDNSTYYVLGYYSEPDAKGGKFRKIDVRLRRDQQAGDGGLPLHRGERQRQEHQRTARPQAGDGSHRGGRGRRSSGSRCRP